MLVLLFSYPNHYVDNELRPYHDEIFKIIETNCQNYNYPMNTEITIEDYDDGILGVCIIGSLRFKIIMNKKYWANFDNDDRFQILAHEYSHCFLKKDHVDNPNNYMYSKYRDLDLDVVKQQFIEDVRSRCQ